jgi:flagellar biosynthetic protein FlhB
MAGEDEAAQERSLEATPHKLAQARRKGEVAQSRDVVTLGLYVGLFVALSGFGGTIAADLGETLLPFLEQPDQLTGVNTPAALAGLGLHVGLDLIVALAPLLLLPALGVVLALAAQQAVVVAGNRITPRWTRISLIATARQRFGPKGLVEFGKTLVKLVAVSVVLALVLWSNLADVMALALADASTLGPSLLEAASRLLVPLLAVSALIAAGDYLWQYFEHLRRQRMTPQELKEEHKQTEVDAHLKQARRDRAMAIATNRMLQEVPAADVVITNPIHFAVALKWDRTRPGSAPHCVAKGADEIAQRIREIAREHGVVLVEDRPLARSLYDLVEIGHEIRVEHYRAVAAALHYAARQRNKHRWN